jgi:hypothetical protein
MANPKNGSNFNRYKYANNNPYKFTDPDGRCPSCIIGAVVETGFQLYTGELQNAVSEARDGNFGALAVSVGKIGISAASGGLSTVAAAKAVSVVGKAYQTAGIGKAATTLVKLQTVGAVQAASGAATKVATNGAEGKPLGDGVAAAATVGAVVGTAGKYAGDGISAGAGSAFGANAKTLSDIAAKAASSGAKKETTCTVQHEKAC